MTSSSFIATLRTAGMHSWVGQRTSPFSSVITLLLTTTRMICSTTFHFTRHHFCLCLSWNVLSKVYSISFTYQKEDSQCCNRSETLLGKGDFSRKLFSNLLLLMHHHFNLFFSHISYSNKSLMKIISQMGDSQCCCSKSYTSSWKRRFRNKFWISQCSRYFLRLFTHLTRHHLTCSFHTLYSRVNCLSDANSEMETHNVTRATYPGKRSPPLAILTLE